MTPNRITELSSAEVFVFGSKKPDGLSYRKMAPSDTYEYGKRRIENGKIYSMLEICR